MPRHGADRDRSLVRGDGNELPVVWRLREGRRVGQDREISLHRIGILTHDQATFAPAGKLEIRAEHAVGDGNGVGRPLSAVLDDDGNRDLRIIERREAGEPGVLAIVKAVFVGLTDFRRPGLAADRRSAVRSPDSSSATWFADRRCSARCQSGRGRPGACPRARHPDAPCGCQPRAGRSASRRRSRSVGRRTSRARAAA